MQWSQLDGCVFFTLLLILTDILRSTMAAVPVSAVNSDVCAQLSATLPGKVFARNEPSYNSSIDSYFFANDRLSPLCIVHPASAQEVSLIVRTLIKTKIKVAVQGGGHTPNAGAANIDGGVTISMSGIKSIAFSYGDQTHNSSFLLVDSLAASSTGPASVGFDATTQHKAVTVSVGAGATFGAVYSYLSSHNLIAVGGRGESLGLGGLLTGGGVGFFGPKYGFACDSVVAYQVVLADGSIVTADSHTRPDLFKALKGGSNNFGIVTRFDLRTYSQGPFWGGFISYPESTIPAQLDALKNFMTTGTTTRDPNAALIASVGYVGAYGLTIASNGLHYTKENDVNPKVFRPFLDIQPQLSNSSRTASNVDFVHEIESMQAVGARATYVTTTFFPSPTIFTQIYTLWSSSLPSLKPVANLSHFLVFQNFPTIRPGNSLGLHPGDENLVILVLSLTWSDQQDDALIQQSTQTLISQIEEATKSAGLFHGFKHLNYAAGWQDPISGYGESSKLHLQRVSRRYDPDGFFQKNVPGGFKVL